MLIYQRVTKNHPTLAIFILDDWVSDLAKDPKRPGIDALEDGEQLDVEQRCPKCGDGMRGELTKEAIQKRRTYGDEFFSEFLAFFFSLEERWIKMNKGCPEDRKRDVNHCKPVNICREGLLWFPFLLCSHEISKPRIATLHRLHRLRPGTYDMLHRAQVEWPCLSVDVIRDDLGAQRALVHHRP